MSDFLGVAYPIVDASHGYFRNERSIDQIKSDLLILLLTNPGERVFLVNYGTPLRDLIFDPNDATLAARAKQMIINSISTWEPRVAISQIQVLLQPDLTQLAPNDNRSQVNNILMIRISFQEYNNITSVEELELAVPLNGPAQ